MAPAVEAGLPRPLTHGGGHIMGSDVADVDEQLPAVGQDDPERVDDPLGQVKLAEDLDVDDLRVGHQKAAQNAARMIGRGCLWLAGVIRGRHATFDQTDLPPRVWLAAAAMAWPRRWPP